MQERHAAAVSANKHFRDLSIRKFTLFQLKIGETLYAKREMKINLRIIVALF
jgi:hypothetical protein